MTALTFPAHSIDLAALHARIDEALWDFLDAKTTYADTHGLPEEIPHCLRDFLDAGGKRLRPLLCVLGWHAADGHGELGPVVRMAASLELFHAFCLIHDDVMDGSDTRRGHPTVHRAFTTRICNRHPSAAADHLGTHAAILIGDLTQAWSDELLHTAGLTPGQLTAVLPVIDRMRSEVMYGQYLDLLAPLAPVTDLHTALRVVRYKTAKYTCERPLQTGAVLAGANEPLLEALSSFALPLGEAFQLRDDLLGVFGNPNLTGKPVLDDLREGKRTVLLTLAAQHATPPQRAVLDSLVGDRNLDEDGAARIRTLLEATRARATVENMITARYEQALTALESAPISPVVAVALRRIAALAVERTL
ncbi:geranylgeranyl diphosphate synthase [Streptomyces sp. CB02959]|uniref:polyprenyl synthetase family protein n=1 Tax=Streptomyces sp. CB02959 TaxID=2020330 RepID=UPI000C26F281|nr:polyprenyl synthetase family protein [Streptomyces sp. CB02959]PJN32316.1 geranylgeranyl diphosphate synthase [Streptomyces sp. CB02959]